MSVKSLKIAIDLEAGDTSGFFGALGRGFQKAGGRYNTRGMSEEEAARIDRMREREEGMAGTVIGAGLLARGMAHAAAQVYSDPFHTNNTWKESMLRAGGTTAEYGLSAVGGVIGLAATGGNPIGGAIGAGVGGGFGMAASAEMNRRANEENVKIAYEGEMISMAGRLGRAGINLRDAHSREQFLRMTRIAHAATDRSVSNREEAARILNNYDGNYDNMGLVKF